MMWSAKRNGTTMAASNPGWRRARHGVRGFGVWETLVAVLLVFQLGCPGQLRAQDTAEVRAFKTAASLFQDGVYELAEREFRRFVATFPQSPMLPEAILLEARAALAQTNLAGTIALLKGHVAKAGPLADQYYYRLATAYRESSNYTAAADSFLQISRQFTNSSLLLEASYGEALARFNLRDFSRVTALLQDPNGTFQQASKARPNDEFTIRGTLLLAESLFERKQYRAAEETALRLAEANLTPEYRWDRQYLLCRVQVADQRPLSALAQTTNLIALASATPSRNLVASSVAMQAGILRQLDRLDEAIQVYTNNLADTVPAEHRRLALLNLIEIKLAQDEIAEAEQMLESFLTRQPDDAASDVALLTSGELQLKLHTREPGTNSIENVPAPLTATNHLPQALNQFEKLLATYPNSPLRGKALLNKGWCLWLDQKIPESAAAFRAAAGSLPFSEDLAVAQFKLADTLYEQADYTNAVRHYRKLTNDFAGVPRVKEALFDQALYQIVRANIEIGDEAAAASALQEMLDSYPDSPFSERSMWLVGQDYLRVKQPVQARQIFKDFLHRFPDRPLRPKVELAIARTYVLERDWSAALRDYEQWLSRYPNHELRPRAEFNLAWSNYRANRPTNAFHLFTNFVARFPTNELAPVAQYWVADEYYRQSNYVQALRNYQVIPENTNWPTTNLTYQARLMAGRSAVAAQLWKDAAGDKGHFTLLLNDRNCPDEIVAEAFFAYGDAKTLEDTRTLEEADSAGPLQKFVEARKAFAKIPQLYPTNRLVPLALGRFGDCCLQLASQDPKQYETATNAYWKAMTHPSADIRVRSLAEYGLAQALELQAPGKLPAESAALLQAAFEHYYHILIGPDLRDKEEPDPFWVEKAGMAAARLKEGQNQWLVALRIYERLHEVLPPLRPRLQDKIEKTKERLQNEQK